MGLPLTRVSVSFEMAPRQEGKLRADSSVLKWRVEYRIPSIKHVKVVASFEPFDGRLKHLIRLPGE